MTSAVLVAAGSGQRVGASIPKQYLPLAGRPMLAWSLETLLGHPQITHVVVVLARDDRWFQGLLPSRHVHTAVGGNRRLDSVCAGLEVLARSCPPGESVLVHDAARPCLRLDDLDRLLAEPAPCALLARPVGDSVHRAAPDGERVVEAVPRAGLWLAQTPQRAPLGLLRAALSAIRDRGEDVSDEATALVQAGHAVAIVPGGPHNLKVTGADDLPLAAYWLERR